MKKREKKSLKVKTNVKAGYLPYRGGISEERSENIRD